LWAKEKESGGLKMRVTVDSGLLVIGQAAGAEGRLFPFACEGMAVMNRNEFIVPIHRDTMGTSTSLEVSSGGAAKPPLEERIVEGRKSGFDEFYGFTRVELHPGDCLEIQTANSCISAKIAEIESDTCVRLKEICYDGPWRNFQQSSCLTFGLIRYETSGKEDVIATGFAGTLRQYQALRAGEDYTSGVQYPSQEEVRRRRQGLEPAAEHAEDMAEALGY